MYTRDLLVLGCIYLHGPVAQLEERISPKDKAPGSIPGGATKNHSGMMLSS